MVTYSVFNDTYSYEVLSLPVAPLPPLLSSPLLSGRTLRRTPAPKGLVVIAGLSAEAPTSYRPR